MTRDEIYMKAVAAGDKVACQLMVDEAAEAWAPKSVVRTPDGKLAPVYRGLRLTKPIDWNLMHTEDVSERYQLLIGDPPEPKATPSFTPDYEIAKAYSGFLSSDFFGEKVSHHYDKKRSKVVKVYLNITLPFDVRTAQFEDQRISLEWLFEKLVSNTDDAQLFVEGVGEAGKAQAWDNQTTAKTGAGEGSDDVDLEDLYDGLDPEEVSAMSFECVYIDPHAIADSESFVDLLRSKGYDGYLFNGPFDIGPKIGIDKTMAEEWRPFKGDQIKLANPITYKDRAHKIVVPLSERFLKHVPGEYDYRSHDARYNPLRLE